MSSSAMVIDGEASETDEETEKVEEVRKPKSSSSSKSLPNRLPDRKSNPDVRLEKLWTQLGTDLINLTRRRTQAQDKMIVKMTEQAATCFSSMQNVAAKLNVVHTNVTRLEDSVADLIEAKLL